MVSATTGIAVLAVLALGALAIGTSVVAGAAASDGAAFGPSGQARCDVASAIHGAISHRSAGETVGSVISEIARDCAPDHRR